MDEKINPVLGELYDRGFAAGFKAGREAGMREAAGIAGSQRDWAVGSDDYNNGCTHCEAAILAKIDK